jgi:PAS domain-containing protein
MKKFRRLKELSKSPKASIVKRYEALVQSIDGIVWEANPQTFEFTFVSDQAEKILGCKKSLWFRDPKFWANHIHPDDRDWAISFCLAAVEKRIDHQIEYRMMAADGRARSGGKANSKVSANAGDLHLWLYR